MKMHGLRDANKTPHKRKFFFSSVHVHPCLILSLTFPPDSSMGAISRLEKLLLEAISSPPIVCKQFPNVRHFAVF